MTTTFKNLTGRPVEILTEGGGVITLLASRPPARMVDSGQGDCYTLAAGVRVINRPLPQAEGLPDPEEGVYFIAPESVASFVRRRDVFSLGMHQDPEFLGGASCAVLVSHV